MNVYTSVPLLANDHQSFRLLEFDTLGEGFLTSAAPLRATLKTYPLHDAPIYQALSYAWGKLHAYENIIINGINVLISPTLCQAITHMLKHHTRDTSCPWRLWVDGLCINQQDDREKSGQVILMKDIYTQAHCVLIWLGIEDEVAWLAIDTLQRFAIDDGTADGHNTSETLQESKLSRSAAIDIMIYRPWFTRVWVIQEVVVARRAMIHWGSRTMDWDQFNHGLQRITGSGFYPFSAQVQTAISIGVWRENFFQTASLRRDESLDLRVLIKDTSEKGATNLRDKVYALRGIMSDRLAQGMTVNYEYSVERVYIDWAKSLLRLRSDLRILSMIRQRERGKYVTLMPSWVPDWSQAMDCGGVLNRYYRFLPEKLFRANGVTQPRVVINADNTIALSGVIVDEVVFVSQIKNLLMNPESGTISISPSLLQSLGFSLGLGDQYAPSNEPLWLALFRTLTADRSAISPRINNTYRMKNFSQIVTGASDGKAAADLERDALWGKLSCSLDSIIEGKVLLITKGGFLAFTEDGCKIGDLICVFYGGEVPFILRKDHDGLFSLHGEAYVHGVMDGEIFIRKGGTVTESFHIK
ncbi:hypothetical protein BP6252_13249 [Coleophoma cylindrospora]|uniref:Heterokaryon incompatibility domain-containing protein n=1 Tax=Coleophoma cylindrospora TaxID=1849047 RepID=A0A3D8QAA5_9HELO|nr:hypothetical protein BP6252_13249 [Coleophoma cylindrospora]